MQTIVIDCLCIFLFLVKCPQYINLTDADRKHGRGTSVQKCDDSLNGWHRFQGDAGRKMMTICPGINKCGARYSAWLRDGHPTVTQGSDRKKVCIQKYETHDGDCCDEHFFINVKNCGLYFIYEFFQNDVSCFFRYCGTD